MLISPTKASVQEIIKKLHKNSIVSTEEGSTIFEENWNQVPLILSGDFNKNFAEVSSEFW